MKRKFRFTGLFLLITIILSLLTPVSALAAGETIDVSTASEGYFSVYYSDGSGVKMKVGVGFAGKTSYSDYIEGARTRYSFNNGDGSYTITLYRNTTGTSYRKVTSRTVSVALADEFSQYLVSTGEITFSATDTVGLKASELCSGSTSDEQKVVAIHNHIAGNFSYDKALARRITSGEITVYVPDTAATLKSGLGICYDFSALFAAMCRSQGIPCVITKGYYSGERHAWNKVYVNEGWYAVDLTYSVNMRMSDVDSLALCVSSGSSYSGDSDGIPLATPAQVPAAAPAASAPVSTIPAAPVASYPAASFTDVSASAWYSSCVSRAYELRLINGTTATTFAPSDKMRVCEAIKLSGCLRSQYYADGEAFTASGAKWYTPYVDYAIANGIIEAGQYDYESYITRVQFARIFSAALPESALAAINSVADGAIPDVGMNDYGASAIYTLYRAGITAGDSAGNFNPGSSITRAEVAAIAVRMADSSYRVSVAL